MLPGKCVKKIKSTYVVIFGDKKDTITDAKILLLLLNRWRNQKNGTTEIPKLIDNWLTRENCTKSNREIAVKQIDKNRYNHEENERGGGLLHCLQRGRNFN